MLYPKVGPAVHIIGEMLDKVPVMKAKPCFEFVARVYLNDTHLNNCLLEELVVCVWTKDSKTPVWPKRLIQQRTCPNWFNTQTYRLDL